MKALALLAAAALLAACSAADNGGTIGGGPVTGVHEAPPGQEHNMLPAAVASAGRLRIGADVGRAPLLFYATGTKVPEGIDADILQAVGRQLGVTVQFVDLPIGQLGPALVGGQIDALASGFVDIKAFEGAGIDFVDELTGRTSVLVKQGNPKHINGPDDLCGRTVAVLAGTAQVLAASTAINGCRSRGQATVAVRQEGGHDAVLADVAQGRADAALDDSTIAQYTAEVSTGDATLQVVGASVDPVPYGIGVARSDPQLRDAIQAALLVVIRDGEYDAALAKWGGELDALRTAPINAGS